MEQTIQDVVKNLLSNLHVDVKDVKVTKDNAHTYMVDIVCDEPSRIIGWHGETLAAIQHLAKSLVRTKEKLDRPPFLLLDTDGYRTAQEDKIRAIATAKIDFVRRTGTRVALRPMSPYYRRIVHTHIASDPAFQDCVTESVGEGDYRQVVIRLKNEKAREGAELQPVMAQEEGDDAFANLDV